MKLLLVADLHLTDKIEDEYRWSIFPFIKKIYDKNKVDIIVILGDITEEKNNHSSILTNRIYNEIQELDWCIILKGNHDYINEKEPFFKFLGNCDEQDRINYISEIDSYSYDNFLFLPHSRNPVEEWKNIDFNKYKYIFMHQPIIGSIGMNGFNIKSGLPSDYFKNYKGKIYSGDIHKRQGVYVGSPYPINFGDSNDGGVTILDTESGKEEFISFISIKKLSIDLNFYDNYLRLQDFNLKENDQIKIRVHLEQQDIFNYENIKKELQNYCKKNKIILKSIEMKKIINENKQQKEEKIIKDLNNENEILKNFSSKENIDSAIIEGGESLIKEYLLYNNK
jgi:predicted phosphodiesterase